MRVCTLHLAITLGIRRFSREIIKKYASYCIIACVLTWLRRRDLNPRPSGYEKVSLFDLELFLSINKRFILLILNYLCSPNLNAVASPYAGPPTCPLGTAT